MSQNDVPVRPFMVNGKEVVAETGEVTELISPVDGSVVAHVAEGSQTDVDAAVSAAHDSFQGEWRRINSRDRTRLMLRFAQLIREHQEELARLESTNVGKPIRESRDEVALAADCIEYYAGLVNKSGGSTIPAMAPGLNMTLREPIGVCALIIPWNFPIAITAWKLGPALAMGNTVVVKPATQTPLTALRLAALALDAGIPPGVVNVICGRGETIGEALVQHPKVNKISFTGSTEVGKDVMRHAADGMKRVTLELGGKSANIVYADADLERAIPASMWSVLGNAGQDCCARSRMLVESKVYDQVLSELSNLFGRVKLGSPLDEDTEMGPLITFAHRERVIKYVELGQSEGANLATGGTTPEAPPLSAGAYLRPALFSNVEPSMYVSREEIFGPMLCVIPFKSEEEAISLANDSIYGLSGSVWTENGEKALRTAKAVETGVISINSGWSVHLEAPFGGRKQSGIGRELGQSSLDHYSELKSIYYYVGPSTSSGTGD